MDIADLSDDDSNQSSDDDVDMPLEEPKEDLNDDERASLMAVLESLNEKLSTEPDSYKSHVKKIDTLKKLNIAESLENARRVMQGKFLLPENLWLDWIEDYKTIANDAQEQDKNAMNLKIEELFRMAFRDFICPDVWVEYLLILPRTTSLFTEEGIAQARKVFEEARTATGLHLVKGGYVWDTCRVLENVHLDHLLGEYSKDSSPENLAAFEAQSEKMMNDFKRQLSIPLRNMKDTMDECREFASKYEMKMDETIAPLYEKALKELKELEESEKYLEDETNRVDNYWYYIDVEKKKDDPARIRMIYERAIADNPSHVDFWYDYLNYTKTTFQRGPVLRDLYKRALRIVSWDNKVWQDYLLVLEKDEEDIEQMGLVITDALDCNFATCDGYSEIWLNWIVILKRRFSQCEGDERDSLKERIRSSYKDACEHLRELIVDGDDGYWLYSLYSYMAILEATQLDNLPRAREIFDGLMKTYRGARLMWSFWSDYYDMERRFGDVASVRSVLHRAVRQCAADNGDAEFACTKLMRFEREVGTLEDWHASQKIVDIRMAKVNKRKLRLEDQSNQNRKWQKGGNKFNKSKDFGNDKKQQQQKQGSSKQQQQQHSPQKAKQQKRHQGGGDQQEEPSHKKPKSSQHHEQGDSIDASISSFKTPTGLPPGFGKKPSVRKSQPAAAVTKEKKSPEKSPVPRANASRAAVCEQPVIQMADECSSVFVSNLAYSLKNVEDVLQKFFQSCGDVTNVSVARSKNGKPRGFAYVSFASSETVPKALALDRQLINERPVYVSPNTKKENRSDVKTFKYSDAMERHKLFVSGLSSSTTESSLLEFFQAHGKVKSARIATNRAGVSKCIAYIEYEEERDASRAILKCDRTKLDGAEIQVAISDPPKRLKTAADAASSRSSRTKVDFGYGRSNVINRSEKQDEESNPQQTKPAKKMDNAAFAALFSRK